MVQYRRHWLSGGTYLFTVTLPDGSTGYTRDGAFQVNADGKLVTGSGNVLVPEINLPNDMLEIAIDPEGRVNVRTASNPDTSTNVGQITLNRFVNPSGMLAVGANVLRPTEASGPAITNTPVNRISNIGRIKPPCCINKCGGNGSSARTKAVCA